jgi:hypothetical protein
MSLYHYSVVINNVLFLYFTWSSDVLFFQSPTYTSSSTSKEASVLMDADVDVDVDVTAPAHNKMVPAVAVVLRQGDIPGYTGWARPL